LGIGIVHPVFLRIDRTGTLLKPLSRKKKKFEVNICVGLEMEQVQTNVMAESCQQLRGLQDDVKAQRCLNCQMDKVWVGWYCKTCWNALLLKIRPQKNCFLCHQNPRTKFFPQICESCLKHIRKLRKKCAARYCKEKRMDNHLLCRNCFSLQVGLLKYCLSDSCANFTSVDLSYCTHCLLDD